MIPTAMTVLVKRTRPSGIMPIRAAAVVTTASCREEWVMNVCRRKRRIPKGKITQETILMIRCKVSMISERTFLMYLALFMMVEA